MNKLSPILLFIGLTVNLFGQSPHGTEFKMDCAACHTSDSWEIPMSSWHFTEFPKIRVSDMTGWVLGTDSTGFNHFNTAFALRGSHNNVDCRLCHPSLVFSEAATECISCHTDMHSQSVGNDCVRCHTANNWLVDNIQELHEENGFPLIAPHDNQSCVDCHTSASTLIFERIGNECINCHQEDFNKTQHPNHNELGFSTDCISCHLPNGDWQPAGFPDHDLQFFPIFSGAHEGQWTDCIDCHTNSNNFTEVSCVVCHVNPETDNAHGSVNGYIYNDAACLACHPTGDADLVFDHNETNFPLTGAHLTTLCLECHATGFQGTSTQCVDCHTQDFTSTVNPDHEVLNLSTDCASCHTTDPDWVPATFAIHDDFYPLNGAHALIANECVQCHNGDYQNTPNTCVGCHLDDFNNTVDPDHEQAQFSTDCATCHTETSWIPSNFDHDGQYFPIYSGAHEGQWSACVDCHTNPDNYADVSCVVCHINPETDDVHTGVNGYVYNDQACLACHPTGDADMPFDHNATNFPLTGGHIGVDCIACHENGFEGTSTNCVDCHTMDFNETVNPDHQTLNLPTDCVTCHTMEPGWMPATFAMHDDFYPLNGAHALIANDCVQCHNGNYNNTPNTCVGCHLDDFNNTTNPNHSENNFSSDCTTCHGEQTWTPSTFDHDAVYPLLGAHALIANDCVQCHNGDYVNTPNTCVGCHLEDFNNTTNPNHQQAQFNNDCATCHGENAWVPSNFDHDGQYFPIYSGAHEGQWSACIDCHTNPDNYADVSCVVCHVNPETDDVHTGVNGYVFNDVACLACHPTGDADMVFDHNTTNFPLTGAHIGVECLECHENGFAGTSTNCVDCHTMDFSGTANPNHQELNLSTDCAMCHTTEPDWMPATFAMHDDFYPLNGAHALIANDCVQCHNGDYVNTPNTCVGCHLDDFNNTTNPNHQQAQFSTDCTTCHAENNWMPATFDHDGQYFPIYSGAHEGQWSACVDCHTNPDNYADVSCVVCHVNPETDDVHTGVNGYVFNDVACLACHPTGDADMVFDHNTTNFPLTGGHIGVECLECHENGFAGTSTNCVDCHTMDFSGTANPNHQELNLSTDCAMCHTTEPDWMPATFAMHDDFYPLNGAHALIANDCVQCHNGDYVNTPNTCVGCHLDDFNNTTNPNHQQAQFSTDCTTCHAENNWMPATFDHDGQYFPIYSGAHEGQWSACVDCHTNPDNYADVSCVVCHVNPETDDVHTGVNGYVFNDVACLACHPTGNADMIFDHNATNFPLTGAHIGVECLECHENGFAGTPMNCVDCHAMDFSGTVNPDHQELGFTPNCITCHTTEPDWMPATFDIHDDYYPLNGAHALIANECATCHNGNYNNTPNTCAGCHLDDYNGAMNPNHQEGNFPMDCTQCHGESSWTPSSFDHNDVYPLLGAHALIANDCVQCHNGDYNNTPNTCVGCHLDDFNGTTNPNHQQAQFNTDCAMCHTESGWMPANFDHDGQYFPIYSGAHNGQWSACVDCHSNPNNYAEVSCVNCHMNPETDNAHGGVNGYVFNDAACLACHPTGDADNTFDHNATNFPLTGGHIGVDCIECHASGFAGTPTDCNFCHNLEYSNTTNPNHSALGIPLDCASCHTTEPGWAPAAFEIHDNYYALNDAHAIISNECIQCHNGDYNNTPNTCAGCHIQDYSGTTNPDHQEANFSTDCIQCHSEVAWVPSNFDHDAFYPLVGAHALIANECATCHNGDYNNTPNTCVGCHLDDFNGTTNPNHQQAQFNTDCAMCHTENGWIPSNFDHDGQYFPIYSGAHDGQWSACVDCHTNPDNYADVSCVVCHVNPETDNAHGGVNGYIYNDAACLACHPTGDADNTFDHNATNFPLTGGHIGVDCIECHESGFAGTPTDCNSCHNLDYSSTTNPNHSALGIPLDCASCHTTEPGWAPAAFEIHDNYYPLTGEHMTVANDCVLCHNGDYNNTPNTCVGCHLDDFNGTTNPNHQQVQFNTDCAMCHTESGWMPANFDHDGQYFPIYSGAHNGQWSECVDCHTNPNNYAEVSCVNCHMNPETDNAHGGVNGYIYNDAACLACHPTGDADNTFDHNATNFPLTGGHIGVDCIECHASGFAGTPTDCNFCHNLDYSSTTNPNHSVLGIPLDCAMCHTTEPGWAPAAFEIHDNYYPLNDAHAIIANECATCHNGDYNNTPNTCAGCHIEDYSSTTNPNHAQLNFSTDCTQCHGEVAWVPSNFDHDEVYPLVGAHALIANDCNSCHNGDYNNTPNTCVGCHIDDFNSTTNPNHQQAQFNTECAMCHTENGWMPANFDHDGQYFPIYSGAHNGQWSACVDCHTNPNNYAEVSCVVCHVNPETNNAHGGVNGYVYNDAACLACHPTGDADNTFDHNATNFPLTGGHIGVDCIECHESGFAGTPTDCNFCHNLEYSNTTNPNHSALGIPLDCAMCHTTEPGWAPATFEIHDNYYPLTGEHMTVANDCVLCHNGNYINTPNTCAGCHQSDYNNTSNPDHQALNIPTNCDQCHTTDPDWMPATFDIHDDYYALNGAHALIANDCAQCHNGNYNNTPNTCIGCHTADYNSTSNPNHTAVNFSTDCTTCHTESAWIPSTFDHDVYYPLLGAHALIASDCNTCHNGDYNNTPNTCVGCHLDNYNSTTSPNHTDVNFSTDCASCHTESSWIPSTFDHDAIYPLLGAHALIATDCNACHTTSDYSNTPNTCVGCHLADYNSANSPNHSQAQFPTDCTMCHNQSAWDPSSFNHDGQYFPIYSGKHNHEWDQCIECHLNPNDYSSFSCIDCHEHNNQNHVNNDHSDVNGYVYESNACYACHPDGND